MKRVLSGIQPTGQLHLGNYLGAVSNWARMQHQTDAFFCLVDLHSITITQQPQTIGPRTLRLAQLLMAAGLDPEVCTLFVQSHLPEHSECAWLFECTVSFGELSRMAQFKDKSDRHEFISAGLFTYPALQAADILLYDADEVPVGDDQRQHVELTRDIAARFNQRYGQTFVLPTAVIPTAGARVMDLQRPREKMSKSLVSPQGTIDLLDEPATIEKKIRRAVTDNEASVHFDVDAKPGVSNLLSILAAATGQDAKSVGSAYRNYGHLKADTAEAVVALLEPIQGRFRELESDPAESMRALKAGAQKAQSIASATLKRAKDNIGFLPPS